MLLQRCTRHRQASTSRVFGLLLSMLVMAGCASSGPAQAPAAGVKTGAALQAVPPRAMTLFEQATAAMAAGDNVEAELRFKAFLLLYPEYPGAYINLAIIHANNDNDDAARAVIDAALALDARHPAILNQLGMLLRRNGKFPEAEAAYLKAVTVSPDYALAHYNLGVLYELYLQRLDVALLHFETYQSLVGEDMQVAKWIADLRRRVAANQRTANTVN